MNTAIAVAAKDIAADDGAKVYSEDYYEILGVPPTASKEQIRAAYRRMAARYHPDRNPAADAATIAARINEAWRVLSNSGLRRFYDETHTHADGGGVGAYEVQGAQVLKNLYGTILDSFPDFELATGDLLSYLEGALQEIVRSNRQEIAKVKSKRKRMLRGLRIKPKPGVKIKGDTPFAAAVNDRLEQLNAEERSLRERVAVHVYAQVMLEEYDLETCEEFSWE